MPNWPSRVVSSAIAEDDTSNNTNGMPRANILVPPVRQSRFLKPLVASTPAVLDAAPHGSWILMDYAEGIVLPAFLLLLHPPFLFGYAKPVPVNFRAHESKLG
jgi:hypothetical protein